ncbi:MAG: hypothetical protein HY931_01750 [Candidatus Falkowbacteria bacterium]|nr:MAG: hypothetical protein HY931_01750 [Candidatus Falkowbacteria bacterium]
MKKEQFLLIIVAIILVSAISLRVLQLFDKEKNKNENLVPLVVSEQTLPASTTTDNTNEVDVVIPEQTATSTVPTVSIFQPLSAAIVSSPLEVLGQAPGNWFFEATLPVKLVAADGEIIAAHYAEAQSDWMTENLVPFKATLEFATTATSGYLIVSKDNPSGLPENDASFQIPVNF